MLLLLPEGRGRGAGRPTQVLGTFGGFQALRLALLMFAKNCVWSTPAKRQHIFRWCLFVCIVYPSSCFESRILYAAARCAVTRGGRGVLTEQIIGSFGMYVFGCVSERHLWQFATRLYSGVFRRYPTLLEKGHRKCPHFPIGQFFAHRILRGRSP